MAVFFLSLSITIAHSQHNLIKLIKFFRSSIQYEWLISLMLAFHRYYYRPTNLTQRERRDGKTNNDENIQQLLTAATWNANTVSENKKREKTILQKLHSFYSLCSTLWNTFEFFWWRKPKCTLFSLMWEKCASRFQFRVSLDENRKIRWKWCQKSLFSSEFRDAP